MGSNLSMDMVDCRRFSSKFPSLDLTTSPIQSSEEKETMVLLTRPSLTRVDSGRRDMLSSLLEERGSKDAGMRNADTSPTGDDGWVWCGYLASQ